MGEDALLTTNQQRDTTYGNSYYYTFYLSC